MKSNLEHAVVVWNTLYGVHFAGIEDIERKLLQYLWYKVFGVYPPRGFSYDILYLNLVSHPGPTS